MSLGGSDTFYISQTSGSLNYLKYPRNRKMIEKEVENMGIKMMSC